MDVPDRRAGAGERDHPSEALRALLRWESAGGGWRLLGTHGDRVTIALLTCDGGEQVDLLESGADDLRAHVRPLPRHP